MLAKLLTAAAVASLAVAPAIAAPAGPATKLSVSRAATNGKNKNGIHGSTAIVAILALSAIIGGTIIALDKGSSKPKSP